MLQARRVARSPSRRSVDQARIADDAARRGQVQRCSLLACCAGAAEIGRRHALAPGQLELLSRSSRWPRLRPPARRRRRLSFAARSAGFAFDGAALVGSPGGAAPVPPLVGQFATASAPVQQLSCSNTDSAVSPSASGARAAVRWRSLLLRRRKDLVGLRRVRAGTGRVDQLDLEHRCPGSSGGWWPDLRSAPVLWPVRRGAP